MSNNSKTTASVVPGRPFPPGVSGNPNGRPKKGETITDLVQELLRNKPRGQEKTYRELFAMRVMKLALEGDMTAIREIWDRMEGSVKGRGDVNLAVQVNNYQATQQEADDWAVKRVKELIKEGKVSKDEI